MVRLIARRLVLGLATVALVSLIIFAGVEALPGDACTAFLERDAQGQLLENCRRDLGLNRSAPRRYLDWVANLLAGDLGRTANGQRPIADLVGPRARNSFLLASIAALVGIPLAIVLGVITALARDRLADIWLSAVAILAMTVPEFVSATVLLLVFSVWLGWFPGVVLVSADAPIAALLPQLVLPVITVTLVLTAHILRMVRSSVIEVMGSDYVQMAVLKGVPYWQVVFRHVLPNALLPAINIIALTIAWLLGGLVVIEIVFNYPGLGRLMIESITKRDLPVVQAIAIILALVYVGVNLLADLMTMVLNPRLRTHHGGRR
ncbi:MAG: ABC transporter permease [Ectothiorhodospiraceae bacterium]|nr:ABC transporter permease [Chromatiales bacterium]MCP5154828.1 ABC transporter permease [Ectothiorhodospiraceae bacterium]